MDLEKYRNNIGVERLESFKGTFENADEEFLVTRYISNIKASQALYPVLSIFEVHLRNAIDVMLQYLIGKNWLEEEITKQNLLYDYDYKKLEEAYSKVKSKYEEENITRGKIIAELNLGFWVNLCSKKYNPKIWTKKNTFRMVFPNFPKDRKESINGLSVQLVKIKNLRNRVFHYEPILKKDSGFFDVYNKIVEIIEYLPHSNPKIIEQTDNFLFTIKEILIELEKEINRINNKKL